MIPALPTLTNTQTQTMRQLVYDRTGIWYADSKLDRLAARVAGHMGDLGVADFTDYLRAITSALGSAAAFRNLCVRITINETSFFRDKRQLNVFETDILPELIRARANQRRLRLWSAACSTGEEPYTLAMIVRRTLGPALSRWNVEIFGTDLSEGALDVARTGVYTDYAVRSLDAVQRAAAFRASDTTKRYELDPAIRSMVTFAHQNLADPAGLARRGTWDVIFCRNVLIYFDDTSRRQCLTQLRRVLAPDGALLLGHSESMGSRTDFAPRGAAGGFAWSPHEPSPTERRHVA